MSSRRKSATVVAQHLKPLGTLGSEICIISSSDHVGTQSTMTAFAKGSRWSMIHLFDLYIIMLTVPSLRSIHIIGNFNLVVISLPISSYPCSLVGHQPLHQTFDAQFLLGLSDSGRDIDCRAEIVPRHYRIGRVCLRWRIPLFPDKRRVPK